MEIHDRGDHHSVSWHSQSRMLPGLVLVGIGSLFFLNNLHIIYLREWFAYWPVVLIAIGTVKLVDSTYPSGRVAGAILLGIGSLFLARNLGYLSMPVRDLWPLILIGVGVLLLFQRTYEWKVRLPRGRIHREFSGGLAFDESNSGPDKVHIDAVFSGGKRVVTSQDFQGGAVASVFGGIELDLRQAGMLADSATLKVDAVFGGVEIWVPRNWSVVMHGVGVFGGYGDHTIQPPPFTPGLKRLIIKGGAVFGGVDVKN